MGELAGTKRYAEGGVYWVPVASGDVITDLEPYIGTFFDVVTSRVPSILQALLTDTWTVGDQLGYLLTKNPVLLWINLTGLQVL